MHRLKVLADQNFTYRLFVDDLPSATINRKKSNPDTINFSNEQQTGSEGDIPPDDTFEYDHGIPVAKFDSVDSATILVYNHLEIIVETHAIDEKTYRIVGFQVEPLSIDWGESDPWTVENYRTEMHAQVL